jgi:pentatricopeptide repeat protein
MFVCRGCLRSLTGAGSSPLGPRLLTSWRTTTASVSNRRTVYMGKDIKVDLRSSLADQVEHGDPRYASKMRKSAAEELRVDVGEQLGYEGVNPKGGNLGKEMYEKKLQAAVKKRLELFPDPYHIAQHVSKALEKGSFDEALMMARMASRNAKVEVSWNHLIDYQLKNKRLHAAIKIYNEVRPGLYAPLP